MSFWSKLFGGGDSLARMRQLLEQKRWAEAFAMGISIEEKVASDAEKSELTEMLAAAGDGLAALNLSEGEAFLRAGETKKAAEHFHLATEQARSSELKQRIEDVKRTMGEGRPAAIDIRPVAASATCNAHCSSSCSTENQAKTSAPPEAGMEFDSQTRIELVVASYPEGLGERYLHLQGAFRDAFLLAHEGFAEEALTAFHAVPEEERDDLYYFERGGLQARLGEYSLASADLEKALELNPEHLLAIDTLVHLEIATGKDISAENRLNKMLSNGFAPAFCLSSLAAIFARRGASDTALNHGLRAVAAGARGEEILSLVAALLEREGRLKEAEGMLTRLPGGGCNGGAHPVLAEFWLRHGSNINKALEAFKGALRSEPANPRWLLRMAQAYLAQGWEKDGVVLLKKALDAGTLDERLQAEGRALLETVQKQRNP